MKKNIFILLCFIVLSVVLTYPLIVKMGSTLPDYNDPLAITWNIAWDIHQFKTDPLNLFNSNTFYPYPNTLAYAEHMLGLALVAWPVMEIFDNPVLNYNFLTLFSFVMAGWGMYLLVYHLTKNRWAAILAGIIFAFAPFRLARAFGQLNILSNHWFPFIFLYLHKFFKSKSVKHALLLTLFFVLESWSSLHYFVFASFAIFLFIVFSFLLEKRLFNKKIIVGFVIFLLLSAIFILPTIYPYWQLENNIQISRDHSVANLDNFSPSIIDYFTPSFLFMGSHKTLTLNLERIVYPGVMALALLAFCLGILLAKIKEDQQLVKILIPYFFIGIIGFILSLGPFIGLFKGIRIMVGPHYLLHFLPSLEMIRTPVRWTILPLLSLSVIIGLGINVIWFKLKKNSQRYKIIFLLLTLVFVEIWFGKNLVFFNFKRVPIKNKIPHVYEWLRHQPEDFAILEIPLAHVYSSEEFSYSPDAEYVYFSAYHWKKIVNGFSSYRPSSYKYLFEKLKELPDKKSIEQLFVLDIKYFIVHFAVYPPSFKLAMLSALEEYNNIELIEQFDNNDYLFEIIK